MGEKHKRTKEAVETQEAIVYLGDGEPVIDFPNKGTRVSIDELLKDAPTGVALIKFANGDGLVANRQSMVSLHPPNESNRFTKIPDTVGAKVSDFFPEGFPELTTGEEWHGSGVPVERVLFRTKYAFDPMASPVASPESMQLESLFDSAEGILQDFERSHP